MNKRKQEALKKGSKTEYALRITPMTNETKSSRTSYNYIGDLS